MSYIDSNLRDHRTQTDRGATCTSLSVIVPVFNEQYLVGTSLLRLSILAESPMLERVQVIVVDDCSTDDTPTVVNRFQNELPSDPQKKFEWVFLRHQHNQGKGAAVRSGIQRADCELTVIHDADLEYHPRDLLQMLPLFLHEDADAVFGSRFLAGGFKRALFFRHSIGNHILTFLCDLASDLNLTDMETCYKMVRTDLLKSIPLVSRDFRIEPELTIKLAKRGARVFEVPISYSGRTYQEGKKIGWKDGVAALLAILQFKMTDRICTRDQYGSEVALRLGRAPKYTNWVANLLRPLVGNEVLEIGAGTGSLTVQLIPRGRYVACDSNPLFVRELRKLTATRPYLDAAAVDPLRLPAAIPVRAFDTIICQNLLEHVDNDVSALRSMATLLREGGRVLLLVPNGRGLFGAIDRHLGHHRRYSKADLVDLADRAGLRCTRVLSYNRACSLPWWFTGRVLRRSDFSLLQVKLVNFMTPLLRRIDKFLPLPPMSSIAVLEPLGSASPLQEREPVLSSEIKD